MSSLNLSEFKKEMKGKDGKMLMGGYSLYLSQLIFSLKTNDDWRQIICQVLMFISMILMREYKKKNGNTSENGSQYDSEAPAPAPVNEPISEGSSNPQ